MRCSSDAGRAPEHVRPEPWQAACRRKPPSAAGRSSALRQGSGGACAPCLRRWHPSPLRRSAGHLQADFRMRERHWATPAPARPRALRKRSPRCLVVAELVKARTRRRQQHDLSRRRACTRGRRAPLEAAAVAQRASGCRAERAAISRRVFADQVDRAAARATGSRSAREVLALALAAEDQVARARRRSASSATSVLATLVALESLT